VDRETSNTDESINGCSTILSALASPLPGPLGGRIAKVTGDIIPFISNSKARKKVQVTGLEKVLSARGTGEGEKCIARFGCDLGSHFITGENLINARNSVLAALAAPTGSPLAVTIAQIALGAGDAQAEPNVSFMVFGLAFKTILDDKNTIAYHRDIARIGSAVPFRTRDISDGLNRRHQLLQRIIDPKAGMEEIEELAGVGKAHDSVPVISMDDNFLTIDGFRLEIHG
jgi:hypothetical protein